MPGKLLLRATAGEHFVESEDQTWNLSKNLHRRISRIKILHRQFHLISTVLVGTTQKMSENGEINTAGKNFTVTGWTNSTSASISWLP